MTKEELIAEAAQNTGISKTATGKVLISIINSIQKALKKGDKVTLVGFGTFSVAKRKARQGRNPATGKPMTIPAGKVPKFKAGKKLKEAV